MSARTPVVATFVSAVVATLACASSAPALADVPEADRDWQLRAAADAGEKESRSGSVSLDYAPAAGGFNFGLVAQYAEAALAGPPVAGDTKPQTTGAGVDLGWVIGPTLLTLGFDTSEDEDFRRSNRFTAGLRVGGDSLGADLHVSRRATDFDRTGAGGTFTLRNGQTITLTGTVACDVDDTGYGLTFDWTGEKWSGYVGGTKYDYQALSCDFSANVPEELRRLSAARFSALSSAISSRIQPRAGGAIARQLQLLDSEFTAGVAYDFEVVALGVDWFHGKDAFAGVDQDDWSATLRVPLGAAWSVEFTGGMTDFDGESSGYGGLAVAVRL